MTGFPLLFILVVALVFPLILIWLLVRLAVVRFSGAEQSKASKRKFLLRSGLLVLPLMLILVAYGNYAITTFEGVASAASNMGSTLGSAAQQVLSDENLGFQGF